MNTSCTHSEFNSRDEFHVHKGGSLFVPHTHASAVRRYEAHPETPVGPDVRASTEAAGAVLLAFVRPLPCAPNKSIFHRCSRTLTMNLSKLIDITSQYLLDIPKNVIWLRTDEEAFGMGGVQFQTLTQTEHFYSKF